MIFVNFAPTTQIISVRARQVAFIEDLAVPRFCGQVRYVSTISPNTQYRLTNRVAVSRLVALYAGCPWFIA